MVKLSPNFMAELFKLMFIDENIMRIARKHLSYQLIPKEWSGYKFVLRSAVEQFDKREKTPSLGVVAQTYADNEIVQETIDEIKEANLANREAIVDQLETYIQETEFEILSKKVHDLYEEGKKGEAIRLNAEESKRILEVSLRETGGNFERVFEGFDKRMKEKRKEQVTQKTQTKIEFGIDRLDDISHGGMDPGDTALWIMRSGDGKSTVLRWHGYSAALGGEPVLHVQLEGGKEACTDKYDQMWTNQSYVDIKKGLIKQEDEDKIKEVIQSMKSFGQDIDVYGFKKFGEASVSDVRNLIINYHKIRGHFPRLVIIDSLDLLKTGLNKKIDEDPEYTKQRLQKCAQLIKDMAVEFNCAIITATQASNVPIEIWNNEEKVIDRSYTEGDKTLVKPFSFVFTGNVTIQEKQDQRLRIYNDKMRDHKESQYVFKICTNYDKGCFYSKKRTVEMLSGTQEQKEGTFRKEERREKLTRSNASKKRTPVKI